MVKNKDTKNNEKVSKMNYDKEDLEVTVTPNVVTTGGIEEIGLKRISPVEIPKYLFMHPALPRGIDIKTNRMISHVSELLDPNVQKNTKEIKEEDKELFENEDLEKLRKEAYEYCKDILDNSKGPLFIKEFSKAAYEFGTGFAVLQKNKAGNKVIRFENQHPIFFGPSRYPKGVNDPGWGNVPHDERERLAGKMKIDFKTKEIDKFSQLAKKYPDRKESNSALGIYNSAYYDTKRNPQLKNISPGELKPVGHEIDKSSVITVAFDRLGDEPLGISLVQFLHLTINYLLNMEKGGAQAMVNFGFPKWKANTPFKSETKMKLFGKSISNIQKDSVVILPEGVTLDSIIPGTSEFDRIHPIYMRLIAIRLGIPMPLLDMSGTSTNKATLSSQKEDMKEDFIADELIVKQAINDGFFKACKIRYDNLSIEELNYIVPNFIFLPKTIDVDKQKERDLKDTLANRNSQMAINMSLEIGDVETAAYHIISLRDRIKRNMGINFNKKEFEKIKKSMTEIISSKGKIVFSDRNKIKEQEEDIDKQTKELEGNKKDEPK